VRDSTGLIEAFGIQAFFDAIAPAQLETLTKYSPSASVNATALRPIISSR
jgi:hypothetical protein